MKYFQVLYFFLQYFFHHLEIRHLGCGLRHQASLFHWGQHLGILYPLQDMYLAFFPIAGDPLHLWVIRRAKEQDRPVCLRLLPYDLMDPGHKGAGGVQHPACAAFQSHPFPGGKAMGTDHRRCPLGDFFQGLYRMNALLLQPGDHIPIVDQSAISIYGSLGRRLPG